MELQPGGTDARRVVERFVLARREHQHVERRRLARQDAGVDEILLDPQRLGGAILSESASDASRYRWASLRSSSERRSVPRTYGTFSWKKSSSTTSAST